MAERRQRPSPIKINAEGPHRAQRPAAKSDKDLTKKERGMERVSDSDLATNCGTYERQASKPTKETTKERACNSPTRLAVARASRKSVFCDRAQRGACNKSSKGDELRNRKTLDKSQAGGRKRRSAEESLKDLRRSRSTGSEDKDGR